MARCKYKTILKELERFKRELLSGSPKAIKRIDRLIENLNKEIEKRNQSDPKVRELVYYAYGKYQEETGNPLSAKYERDGKIVKRILKSLKPLAEAEQMETDELFKILWDFFVNRYPKARTGGMKSFEDLLQRVYEFWKRERNAPIDFGMGAVSTEPVDHNKYYDGEF
jgi:broad specificity phosphatase PhoE